MHFSLQSLFKSLLYSYYKFYVFQNNYMVYNYIFPKAHYDLFIRCFCIITIYQYIKGLCSLNVVFVISVLLGVSCSSRFPFQCSFPKRLNKTANFDLLYRFLAIWSIKFVFLLFAKFSTLQLKEKQ